MSQVILGPDPFFRRALDAVRRAPATFLFLGACVALFVVAEQHGSTEDVATLVRFGATERRHVWAGEVWRLVTAAFLHIGVLHLAWNVVMMLGWCMPVERALGTARFAVVYLGAAIAGSATSLLVHDVIGAGASGAGFGVIGASLTVDARHLGSWRAFAADRRVRHTAVLVVLWTVGLAGMMNVDHAAHLGGFLGGIALTWALTAPDDASPASRRWAWSVAAVAVALPAALAVIPRSGATVYDVAAIRLIRQEDIPRVLRVLPLRNTVLFPAGVLPMEVHSHEAIALIKDALRDEPVIGVVTQRRIDAENPGVTGVYSVGTVGRLVRVVKMTDDNYTVAIQGLARFKVLEPIQERPYLKARIVPIDDETPAGDAEVLALALDLKTAALDAIKAQPELPPEASDMVKSIRVPGHLADLVAANMDLRIEDKQQVLETVDLKTRMKLVRGLLTKRFSRP